MRRSIKFMENGLPKKQGTQSRLAIHARIELLTTRCRIRPATEAPMSVEAIVAIACAGAAVPRRQTRVRAAQRQPRAAGHFDMEGPREWGSPWQPKLLLLRYSRGTPRSHPHAGRGPVSSMARSRGSRPAYA